MTEIEEVALNIHRALKEPPTDPQDALRIVFGLMDDTPSTIRAVAEALWERCRGEAEQQPAPDELSDYDRGFRDGKLDQLIDEVVAESELVEALQNMLGAFDTPIIRRKVGSVFSEEAIASAHAALAAHRKQQESSHDRR